MDEVANMLQQFHLSNYVNIFNETGYHSVDFLLRMRPEDFGVLASNTNMLPGHVHLLREQIRIINVQAQYDNGPSQQHVPAPPAGSGPAMVVHGPAMVVHGSAMVSGPAIVEHGPAMVSGPLAAPSSSTTPPAPPPYPSLKNVYPTWDQAKLATLTFSTSRGCSVIQDRKKSGSRRKVYRCRSVVSKRKRKDLEEGASTGTSCPHVIQWSKKKGSWHLDMVGSHLAHAPFCWSEQCVTQFELTHCPVFIKHAMIERNTSGRKAILNALGHMGRIDGCVKYHTARRAQNNAKRWHLKDYDDDWCKLQGWGAQYMRSNPESRFDIRNDPEEEDRSYRRAHALYLLRGGQVYTCTVFGWAHPRSQWARTCMKCICHRQVPEIVRQHRTCHPGCLRCRDEIFCCRRRLHQTYNLPRRAVPSTHYPRR
jgi:hypothetical protein